jgi:hypothetical protein
MIEATSVEMRTSKLRKKEYLWPEMRAAANLLLFGQLQKVDLRRPQWTDICRESLNFRHQSSQQLVRSWFNNHGLIMMV